MSLRGDPITGLSANFSNRAVQAVLIIQSGFQSGESNKIPYQTGSLRLGTFFFEKSPFRGYSKLAVFSSLDFFSSLDCSGKSTCF